MTFFLAKPAIDPAEQDAIRPPREISTFMQGLGAAYSQSPMGLEKNFGVAKTRNEVKSETNDDIISRLGEDEVWRRLGEKGLAPQTPVNDMARKLMRENLSWRTPILEMGREAAKATPESWGDARLSEEQWEEETNARLRAEYEDGQEILDMMPSGRGVAEFVGESAAMLSDVKNLPFLLLGGGSGSLWRVASREAMINTAAEGAFLPAQFDMAERLEIPDPDVLQTLTTAALVGAGFGVALEGGARAIRYARARNTVTEALPGRTVLQTQSMVDTAEDILATGRADALEQIARIPERTASRPPYLLENPINPERPPLIARPEEQAPETAQPEPMPSEVPPEAVQPDMPVPPQQSAPDAIVADLEAQADAMQQEATRGNKNPLLQALRRQGVRIDPKSPEAQELYSILGGGQKANQTVPGLFKRGGVKGEKLTTGLELDTLPASEWEEIFPGISAATGVDNGYLSRQGVLDVIGREAAGDMSWLQRVVEANDVRKQADEVRREAERTPETDFLDGRQAEDGFHVNLAAMQMAETDDQIINARIAEDTLAWMQERGWADILTPQEMAEIIAELQRRGGDAEYLVERVLSRELDYAKAPEDGPAEAIPFDDDDARGRGIAVPRDPFPEEAGGGAAGAGRGEATPEPQFERTAAGEQQVAPGIEAVSERDRLQAQMDRPMRGGNAAADDGLFDTNARLQPDMFEPESPAFTTRLQSVAESFRDDITAQGDFDMRIELEDGRTLTRASEVLDYLDEGDDFADIIALCGRPRGDTA